MTLLLSRSDLESVLDPGTCLDALRRGFTAATGRSTARRVAVPLPGGSATALLPGLVAGIPAYTVKVNAKFPDARPALRGVVCLHGLDSGELLALLDSATVTAWRTGLAAALGTHVLARQDARSVAVIGAGAQAELVLRGLPELREVTGLTVYDTAPDRAADFAHRHGERLGVPAAVAPSAAAAAAGADVVVTATWARQPVLYAADVRPGAHVTSLGADEPGKAELGADLLRRARVVVDDRQLAAETGALAGAEPGVREAAGTLGEVLRGDAPGRTGDAETTVYAPVGLPWQDLAVGWAAYRAALAAGRGREADLLA
ncbi:ornithine cyclodeaminase family protein [Actinacidiphila bryophytorum]|uniref:ornithine cyclodeaminase family protein n=1 Tax=Actinacidiphila bryophytorum TaxID=1436133 RepID=UPI002176B4D3|nr:ornithine cyclodeaminase family protein [Actinacidiphila bryophytorum]UWE10800.1 ornithine cyclodeaminase family protein [Actinacidiphila bryophytorum]